MIQKANKHIFATHPIEVPGQSRKIAYVYVFSLSPILMRKHQ